MTAAAPAPRKKVEVVEFSPPYADALAAFIRKVWDPTATAESVLAGRARVAAENPACVDGRVPTALLLIDGEVVGHLTSLPDRVAFSGSARPIAWIVGFHVLPEYRNGPIGVMVAKEMARLAPFSMCSMVLDAPLRIFTALGWRHAGTVPNQLRIIDGAAFARRLDVAGVGGPRMLARLSRIAQRAGIAGVGGALLGAGLDAWASTARVGNGIDTLVSDAAAWTGAAEADRLWERCAPSIRASLVRDGARIRYRFGSEPGRYFIIDARQRGALLGWIILRRPRPEGDERLGGLRVAPVSDLLFPPDRPEVGARLVAAATRFAQRERFADALLASTPHEGTQSLLQRQGFVRYPGTLHLVVHPNILPEPAPAFADWWHARGDGDADQGF